MAPLPFRFPTAAHNASSSITPQVIQLTQPFQPGIQAQWGPDSIGTIVFGVVMFFIALVALWQNGRRRLMGARHEGGEWAGRVVDALAMDEIRARVGGVRAVGDRDEVRRDGDGERIGSGGDEGAVVAIGEGGRTDTEITLIGAEEVVEEGKRKEDVDE